MRLDRVILECHNFFVDFPTLSWKTRANNMPLRTVKTILNSLCNILGDKIPAAESKDQQLQKTLENKKEISRILKRTGHKETTKQGLSELYNFIEQNPDFDMEQYYRKLSPEFREYIAKGLKKMSNEKTKVEKPNTSNTGFVLSSECGISAMEALQRLRQKGGLAPSSKISAPTLNSNPFDENFQILPNVQSSSTVGNNINRNNEQEQASSIEDFHRPNATDENVVAESQVDLLIVEENDNTIDDLKLRLEKIKRGGAF
uniref:Uncharacterized protein n=1 Tax=Romanomermis culicivorax TaxID=13658 RepID=A0A915IH06_ROMCU